MGWISSGVAACLLAGSSQPTGEDLSIRGLKIGGSFDQAQLRPLLERMECGAEQDCRGYLYILNRPAFARVEGSQGRIAKIELTFDGTQYASVRDAFTGKYGKPAPRPDGSFGKAPNFVVESQIVEWRDARGAVLRLSEDLKVQIVTLTLFAVPGGPLGARPARRRPG